LRVDSVKKIVRNETVLDFINQFYKIHEAKDKEEKRNLLKAELLDKIVMTNYGKNRYLKIVDIHFINIKEYFIDDKTNLVAYYQNKYQINIKNANQPALVM
jgi:hypothetical protein